MYLNLFFCFIYDNKYDCFYYLMVICTIILNNTDKSYFNNISMSHCLVLVVGVKYFHVICFNILSCCLSYFLIIYIMS